MRRIILIVSLLSLGPALSACADFDPDKLDIFGINEKKKLPGERRALFPEGVPGVTQGVPPELIKGHQPAPEEAAAVETPPVPAAEKPKPKPKPKPRVVRRPPASAPAQSTQQQSPAPWPSAPPAQQPQQAQQAPWPAPAPAQPQQQAPSPWPAPPPAGTFSR